MIVDIGVTVTYDTPGMSCCSARRTCSTCVAAGPRVRMNRPPSFGLNWSIGI